MQFTNGAKVVDADGEKIGTVDRVVVNPNGGQVTHIVVRKGFVFQADKVVPVGLIKSSGPEEIYLKEPKFRLGDLPDYIETDFVPLDSPEADPASGARQSTIQSIYWYPAIGSTAMLGAPGYWGANPPLTAFPYEVHEIENIPRGSVALQEGADVLDEEGQKIGKVEKVLVEDQGKHVTHLVIERGAFNKERKIVPAGWIKAVKDDGVQLSVKAGVFDRLRDYP